MIDSVPLIQNANDAQQINASIIAMKKASRELDEKIVKLNSLNSELDKKIALLDNGLNKEIEDRKEAINSLDVPSVGGSGKYISAISETDGKISATASDITSSVSSGNSQPVTSGGVYNDSFLLREEENSDIDNYPIDGVRAYRVAGKSIGWVANDGVIINIPWSNDRFGAQIAIDDQSNWLAIRTKSQGTWSDWDRIVNEEYLKSSWVDTGILSSSLGSIKYKKIGSLVALSITSTNGSLKFTENGGVMKKVIEGVETIIYLPEEIRPATLTVNFPLLDNTFDTIFHARITSNGAITAWNNTLKNIQDVNSWNLSIVYSI